MMSVVSVAVVVGFPEESLLPKSFSFTVLDKQLDVMVVFVVAVVVDFPYCSDPSTSLTWTTSWLWCLFAVVVVVDFPYCPDPSTSLTWTTSWLWCLFAVVVVVDFPYCPNPSTSLAWTTSWMWWWWCWLWLLLAVESPSALALQLYRPRQLPHVVDHSGTTALVDWV